MKLDKRKLTGQLGAIAFRMVQKWLSKRDPIKAERLGAKLGRIAFRLDKKHRLRTIDNLQIAFPEKTDEERYELARQVFEHFGRITSDFVRTPNRTSKEVLDNMSVSGEEHLLAAVAKGKGVLYVSAHFGNWERSSHWMAARGFPMHLVVRDANNPDLNQLVVDLREASGNSLISRGNAARAILTHFKNNEIVAMLPDQNSSEVFVPFFGKPCGTVKGPAVLTARSGAELLVVYCVRIGEGKYLMEFQPPLVPDPSVDDPIEGITRAINNSLESMIRRYPDQYLWLHNRWKSAKQRGLL